MAEKLIELRQRFRGYEKVKTDESDDDSEEEVIGVRNTGHASLILGVSHRPAGGYRDPNHGENTNPKISNMCAYICLCGSISGVVFLSVIAHMLESDYLYIQTGAEGKKTALSGGVVGAIYMYVLTALLCIYIIISKPQEVDLGRIND